MSESPQEKTQPEAEPVPGPEQETAAEPAGAEPAAEPVAAPARTLGWRGIGLAFMVIVIVAGLLGWYWYQGRIETGAMRKELAQKLASADVKALENRRVSEQVGEAMSAVQGKLGALESRVGQTQAQLAALETLLQDLSRNRDDWAVVEIEQTLIIASQQLRLSGNVKVALAALRTAEEKLQRLAQPQLTGVRQAISGDIARLQGHATVDTVGISAQLDELLVRVDTLPLSMDMRPQSGARSDPGEAEEPLWKRLLRETWEELKQLVRVQRMDRPDIPLLAPSQAFFLRENLKLRLLGARLGLLARDMQSYKADLGAARDWLQRYYDVRNDAVARDVTMLSNLHAAELSAEVPDISASLEAVRGYRRARADATQKP
ncbi:MAG: uroporphyrinogen-III C-methyltransferase [Betaproteobacteria bacterium]|nr:uroporphyrinogen-III C-methyltransferase [Betaproteobacteria bacterium]MDH3436315.1 uroporphyrinogen-III C-methyltransferase [Betaproteobacteria bacterium]